MCPPLISPGTPETIAMGGRTVIDGPRIIRLVGNLSLGGAAAWTSLREQGGTAGYAVTSGKTLKLIGVSYTVDSAAAGVRLGIGYADTDVGINAVAGGTNQKYPGNSSTMSNFGIATAAGNFTRELNFDIPAGKIPNVAQSAGIVGVTFMFWGYEV